MVLSVKEAYRIVKENDKHNVFNPSMAAENKVHIAFGNDDNIIRGVNKFTGEYFQTYFLDYPYQAEDIIHRWDRNEFM